jgi:hypothetical protein
VFIRQLGSAETLHCKVFARPGSRPSPLPLPGIPPQFRLHLDLSGARPTLRRKSDRTPEPGALNHVCRPKLPGGCFNKGWHVPDKADTTLDQIQETQAALRESIETAKDLVEQSDRLIKKHRQEIDAKGD